MPSHFGVDSGVRYPLTCQAAPGEKGPSSNRSPPKNQLCDLE